MITLFLSLPLPLLPNASEGAHPTAIPPTPLQEMERGEPGASAFSYDYVEAAAVLGDLDGVRVAGSLHLEGPWIALGRFEYLTEDEGAADVDLKLLSAGVGYVHSLERDLDLVGSAEIEYGEIEVDNPGMDAEDDDLGLLLRGGARYQATDEVEVAGGISLSTIFDEELGADGRVLYAFNERISAFVGFDHRDDTFGILGLRFNF